VGGSAIVFSDTGVGIGSFGTVGSTFSSFVLQAGIYQVHLSIDDVSGSSTGVQMWLNNAPGASHQSTWSYPGVYATQMPLNISGDRLLAVASANTTLSFQVVGDARDSLDIGHADCILIITQLQ
jgi:hypothetical protein